MFKDLYFSKEQGKYYFLGIQPCQKCKKLVNNVVFICRYYSRKNKSIFFYCEKCVKYKEKFPSIYNEIFMALVTDTVPKDSFPVFDVPPTISNQTNSDVFIMAYENKDGAKIIDRAIQSRNTNFMIQSDAKDALQIKADLEEIDRRLLPDQADDVLNDLLNAEPVEGRFLDWDKDEDDKDKKRLK